MRYNRCRPQPVSAILTTREFWGLCGCSSMVERELPKLNTRVRFPSPALPQSCSLSFSCSSSNPPSEQSVVDPYHQRLRDAGCFRPDEGYYEIARALPSLARCRCEPSASPRSRRDPPIVAWHEVPGKASSKEPSRRVRYDRAQLVPVSDVVRAAAQLDGPFPEAAKYRDRDGLRRCQSI
jgi:hypothetical protein